jgi:hypothetical protein
METGVGVTRVPRTLGTLSIVFASVVLFFSLFGLIGLVVPILVAHAPPSSRPEDAAIVAGVSRMYGAMGGISALLAVMSGALLALGIGQRRYRKWAAVWGVRWAVVALGAVVIMAWTMATMFSSSMFDMMAASNHAAAAPAHDVGRAIGMVYAVMMVMLYAPYPIVMLVLLTRRHVRAAMTA